MDYVDRMVGRSARFEPDTLLKFTPLSRPVQEHLIRVYFTLACALGVAALGTWANLLTGFGGMIGILGFVVCASWLASLPPSPSNLNKRYMLLGGAAFSQGATLGPLVAATLSVDPALLLTAFAGTAAVFTCFSVSAMLSQRRSWLYLGGTLSSAISLFAMMRLATWMFGGRAMLFQAELYGGLIVFLGYVLFDTQVIIEKAYAGNKDHIKAALDLFVDFVAIFVRMLVLLLQNDAKKDERRRKRR
ncbi:hypothetical protein WJX81_006510 [Elliptochloris bilobata]|uniref:Bax inhibitor 1 n=1 Tax=Elliptochloris bilobata TaxID=381761 RepID=A0AAW1RE24_9CHLO